MPEPISTALGGMALGAALRLIVAAHTGTAGT